MTDTIPKWQRMTGWVLSGLLAFVFLPSAFFKIAQNICNRRIARTWSLPGGRPFTASIAGRSTLAKLAI